MTVKVKNISGLENYATSIQGFAGKFELAANDTVREFNTSLEGEKAEAINAFFSVLNNIQTTIFSTAPEAIRTYGRYISTFTDAIKGLGFSSLAYTDDDAMTTLLNSLTTPQRNEITIVKDNLVTVLDEAVEAMGEGDSSLGSFDLVADMYITTEILARSGTHTGIILADSALSDNVNGSAALFTSLTAQTRNAKAVTKVSIPDLLEAIKTGYLSKDKMVYLYRVKTDADVEILNSQLSGNIEEIANIMAKDPAKVSSGAYTNVAEDMTSWMDGSAPGMKNMNRFLNAIEKADQSVVKTIAKNLGDQQAIRKKIHVVEMSQFEKSADYNETEMDRYKKELKEMNDLSGLLASIAVLKIGTEHKREEILGNSSDHKVKDSYTRRGLSVSLNDSENPEWELTVSTSKKGLIKNASDPIQGYDELKLVTVTTFDRHKSHFESGIVGSLNGKYQTELEEIEQEQKKAVDEFWASVGKNGIKTVLEFVGGPVASSSFNVLTAITKPDVGDGVENAQKVLEEITSGRIKTIIKNSGNYAASPLANVLQDYMELDSKFKEFEQKRSKTGKNIYDALLGQGGWTLERRENGIKSKAIAHSSEIYTDYGAYKRAEELNERGVMGFLEKQGLTENGIEKINKYFKDDPRMRDFLLGEHPDIKNMSIENMTPEQRNISMMIGGVGPLVAYKPLTIQDMTTEQILEMESLLTDVVGGDSNTYLNDYFHEKYGA